MLNRVPILATFPVPRPDKLLGVCSVGFTLIDRPRRLFVAQLLGSLATLSVQYFVLFKAHKAVDKANTLR